MQRRTIEKLFHQLNAALAEAHEIGEIGIVGGAVMCLVYQSREATRDVDAVFEPAEVIRQLAGQVGEAAGVGPDWLNDAVKGFMVPGFERQAVLNLSNLRIWAPEPRYMLAMKCLSARWDSSDRDDVIFLIQHLGLERAQAVF